MGASDLFRPRPEACIAFGGWTCAESPQRTPRQNHLIAALPADDYERLLPDLEPVPLPPGWIVHGAGDRERHAYFLTAGIVSRVCVTESGASEEFAVTGSEGVIGVASFMGGESTPSRAVVLSAGYAYRLGADLLHREFEHDGPLPRLLLRYLQALITQETVADMLGVRREGVTEAAGRLQRAGLIDHHRGHIAVIDRARLEARACECYAIVRRAYDELRRAEKNIGDGRVDDGTQPRR